MRHKILDFAGMTSFTLQCLATLWTLEFALFLGVPNGIALISFALVLLMPIISLTIAVKGIGLRWPLVFLIGFGVDVVLWFF